MSIEDAISPRELRLYADYSRQEAHDILQPEVPFTPQTGTWGLLGIVEYAPKDLVFFVTFGRVQGDHEFDEGITTEGVLTWQSQPRQKLSSPKIQELIEHDEELHSIHLFLRTADSFPDGRRKPYTYLGPLKYLSHDRDRERPVHFEWQLMNWPPPPGELERVRLRAQAAPIQPEAHDEVTASPGRLIEVPPPIGVHREGVPTETFRARKAPDYAKRDAANRELGLAGELLVLEHEKRVLEDAGRPDLASKVRHVSAVEGDGAGYDILSFNPSDGKPKQIEVKTTRGPATTDFYLSANEVAAAAAYGDAYVLYRLHDFDAAKQTGAFYAASLPLEAWYELRPLQFRARLLPKTPYASKFCWDSGDVSILRAKSEEKD